MSNTVQAMFLHVSWQVENEGRRNKQGTDTRILKFSLRTIFRALLKCFFSKAVSSWRCPFCSFHVSREECEPTGWKRKKLETIALMGPKKRETKRSTEAWIVRQLISQATLLVSAEDAECDIKHNFKEQLHHKNLYYYSLGNLLLSFVNVLLMHLVR
jgi:hypothetical protein